MTIITSDAVGQMRDIHDRMPLILPASEWDAWLDPHADPEPMLTPPSEELVAGLELRPIGPRVGPVANDDPELLQRVEPISPAVLL
jgi:putative SOS response-associated peptidase YedK